jgi:hypothetical protein
VHTERKPKGPRKDNKWAWKDTLPKAGDPTTKEFEGKQYHVNCPYHPNQWVCHSAQECSKNPTGNAEAPAKDAEASPTANARRLRTARFAAAAAALETEINSGDESQGDDY